MVHNCMDWTLTPPLRKSPLLVLSWGDVHVYTKIPEQFEALVAFARKKFDLETSELEFYSSCVNFCSEVPADVTQDVWEHIAPYIGCITVVEKTPPRKQLAATRSDEPHTAPKHKGGDSTTSHMNDAHKSSLPSQKDQGSGLNNVAPLQKAANRWVPISLSRKGEGRLAVISRTPEMVEREITAVLNKLTPHFIIHPEYEQMEELIGRDEERRLSTAEIIALVNKSDNDEGNQDLVFAARSLYERAIDDPDKAPIYVQCCWDMSRGIGKKVQLKGISTPEGKQISGGQFFQQLLLEHVQRALDGNILSWGSTIASMRDQNGEEPQEEHYEAQTARRRGLGLVSFVGELFVRGVFPARIIFELLKRLLRNVDNPTEGEIEGLYTLLKERGRRLDVPEYRGHMDIYFKRISELSENSNLSLRLHHLVQDLIELRVRGWQRRPSKADEIHLHAWFFVQQLFSDSDDPTWMDEIFLAQKVFKDSDPKLATRYFEEFKNLKEGVHGRFIHHLVHLTVDGKESDSRQISKFFEQAASMGHCSPESFEEGFKSPAENLDDTALDVPNAYRYMAMMLKGAGFDNEEERLARIASKVKDSNKLINLVLW
ncbi:hypothetical protein HYDPIDRAFT_118303 [Hydnomerulius pinastri MD-312]|uniref:Unplaced genomic scaffold scaffold_49, whole genome shotgun sequence n=1 Tax=Hydnomerulius pinastri MD-312 TaxID=994086 RepID=A0A0C9W9S0_9AGAM|nr:hypothetical protein HYDPIDRAFT_118303 [Hydnomerulius pinastri MD-312]